MTLLFRKIFDEGVVPKDLKEADVVVVIVTQHLIIALLALQVNLQVEVFEYIVRNEVVHFLEKNKLIKDSQHGFRKGSSCLTNLWLFLDKILRSVDEGYCVDDGILRPG